jgi:plastocyanin
MYRAVVSVLFLICAAPAFAEEPTVTITLRDHQFVPAEVPVPAGVRVKLIIRNEQATNAEFESTSLHREKIISPGGEIAVFVGPLDPGRYEFFDDFHPTTRGHLVTTTDPWTKGPAR